MLNTAFKEKSFYRCYEKGRHTTSIETIYWSVSYRMCEIMQIVYVYTDDWNERCFSLGTKRFSGFKGKPHLISVLNDSRKKSIV